MSSIDREWSRRLSSLMRARLRRMDEKKDLNTCHDLLRNTPSETTMRTSQTKTSTPQQQQLSNMDTTNDDSKGPALVFGASGIQGRAVIRGFVENGYSPVYGVSRQADESLVIHGATLVAGDFGSVSDIERILSETRAQAIFVVTTTELPVELGGGTGYQAAADVEYQTIYDFFQTLVKVFDADGLKRHVVLSTNDNVQRVCQDVFELTGKTWIEPLDDGSIVPHYSGKGRAGEEAMELLDGIDGLYLTCLTLPFLHSNFLGFFTPLPNAGETQWSISACFGDNHGNIDMLSASDLAYIVRKCFCMVALSLLLWLSLSYTNTLYYHLLSLL